MSPGREEFCLWCGKRRSLRELSPLASADEDSRQYACLRTVTCALRRLRKTVPWRERGWLEHGRARWAAQEGRRPGRAETLAWVMLDWLFGDEPADHG